MTIRQNLYISTGMLLMALLHFSLAKAQSSYYIEDPKVFTGGPILGMNMTQIDGDSYWGYHKVGLNVGGVVYVHFNSIFGASMEMMFTQKGSKNVNVTTSQAIGQYADRYSLNLNYVEVPLLLHAKANRLDFEAGAAYARLVSSNEWAVSDVPVVIDPEKNKFNSVDVDYILGVNIKLYKELYFDFRYQYSIVSIRDASRIPLDYGYGAAGQFNNMFSMRLMYLF